MSWLNHFPGTPRPVQTQVLEQLEENFDKFDIFIVSMPVGAGKTLVAKTLQNIFYSSAYLAPTNQLLEQFLGQFSDARSLHKLDSYWCGEYHQPSSVTRRQIGGFCPWRDTNCEGCREAGRDLAYVKFRGGPIALNYHTFIAHKLSRDLLILDEGHNSEPILRDLLSRWEWQHNLNYPDNAYTPQKLIDWVEKLPHIKRKSKRVGRIYENLVAKKPEYTVSRDKKEFNGKGTRRGFPEMRDCLKLTPVDISNSAGGFLWQKGKTKKLVILSATIGREDVLELGLHKYLSPRICYLECKSPIPPENRPVYALPELMLPVTYQSTQDVETLKRLAANIIEICSHYPTTRGVVHATYGLASKLKPYLQHDSRFMFHSHQNKQDMYKKFTKVYEGIGIDNRVLVASGMYEGVDLPGDLGRFQIISKIPWPSLADPATKYKSENRPEWYIWETLKSVIQASGRICRGPEDQGDSFIIDSTFKRLYSEATKYGQVPSWFEECIKWEDL